MKPILFNTEMVRAILDGRKTVTRRVIDRDIVNHCDMEKDGTLLNYQNCHGDFINPVDLCRYKVNDILYVRETWQEAYELDDNDQIIEGTEKYIYAASPEGVPNFTHWVDGNGVHRDSILWRPSIHMPKEAARIFLKVTGVCVERLQDMRLDDFKNEGTIATSISPEDDLNYRFNFSNLWDNTIKKDQLQYYSWGANPYVWVIEFEVIDKAAALKEGQA